MNLKMKVLSVLFVITAMFSALTPVAVRAAPPAPVTPLPIVEVIRGIAMALKEEPGTIILLNASERQVLIAWPQKLNQAFIVVEYTAKQPIKVVTDTNEFLGSSIGRLAFSDLLKSLLTPGQWRYIKPWMLPGTVAVNLAKVIATVAVDGMISIFVVPVGAFKSPYNKGKS